MGNDARLNHKEMLEVQQAAISAGLAASRAGLLVGLPASFVASLPQATTPGEQMLVDLNTMNAAVVLADGTVPLAVWLRNAITLSASRRESTMFEQALSLCELCAPGKKAVAQAGTTGRLTEASTESGQPLDPIHRANKEPKMSHVFLSYVREDSAVIERLSQNLKDYGIEVWFDREQLKPGHRWAAAIQQAIRNGAFYIACFSTQYNMRVRTYMNEELTVAIEELRQRPADRAWFIPILLDDCVIPDRSIGAGETLRSLQWVNLFESWDKGVARLLSTIQPESRRIFELELELESKSARARIAALDHLARLGSQAERLTPKLLEQLQHPNQTVKRAAVAAAAQVAGPTKEVIHEMLGSSRVDLQACKLEYSIVSPK